MGNTVTCSEPKKKSRPTQKTQNQSKSEIVAPPKAISTPRNVQTVRQPQSDSFNCILHPEENIKAICLSEECTHQYKTLCCECLIDNSCQKKQRVGEFVRHLRNALSKDAQDLFIELFDDKNQVKLDLSRQIIVVMEMVQTKMQNIAQKGIQSLISNYYWASQKLPLKLDQSIVHQLQLILDNKAQEASGETLDLAIYLMQNKGTVEMMCEQIEKKKNHIQEFANDFQRKFLIIMEKYGEAIRVFRENIQFLFNLLITPMEYLVDEDQKPQGMSKRILQAKEVQQPKVQTVNVVAQISQKCLAHSGEVLAICVKLDCQHKDRKMCADCLIDTKCVERMKLNEFCSKIIRIISKEYIEQLALPWDDQMIYKMINKLFQDGIEYVKQLLNEQQQTIVKDMFIRFHLIEEATPKELRGSFTKEYFDQFVMMMNTQKVSQQNQSVILGIKFINNHNMIEHMLGAIVKTEQVLPKKGDKLQHKLLAATQLFLEKISSLLDLYKQHGETDVIQKQFQLMQQEPFSLEESIYKIKNDGKSLSDWQPYNIFKPSDKYIIDICFVNEIYAAIAFVDGTIQIYNLTSKKTQQTLKHGNIVTSLRAFQFNGQSVLVSSGYSSNAGHTICTWDLKSNKANFSVQQAHNDSIRKLKFLHVNPLIAQTFYSNNSTTAQLSSQISQTGSMNSIFLDIEEQLISCSDDGSIKLWKLDINLKLVEEQVLRTGAQVLDFTLLNGCILVSAQSDKTLQLSLPFQQTHPFQQLQDDCPVHAISPIDQLQSKKKHITQQKFITGNEKGIAKIYQWQNGRAVIMKILSMHSDKITKISMLQPGFVASSSADKSICLTLIQQAKVLTRIEKHNNGIISFAYLKANGLLISADSGGTVIVWQ